MKKTKFEPMLAARNLPEILRFPLLGSMKIDGYRCVVRDGVAYSRKLKPIVNPYIQEVLGQRKFNGLDGELTIGPPNARDLINRMGEVRRKDGTPDFHFYVFDDFECEGGYARRLRTVMRRVMEFRSPRISGLTHSFIPNLDNLTNLEEYALKQGYEGLIIRDPEGPYKYGRSTENEGWMLKVKRWQDDEMRIESFEEEMENTNEAETNELGRTKRSKKKAGMVGKGRLGAFVGPDLKTGVEVRVGGGLTAEQRADFWKRRRQLRGGIVTYKHFDRTGVKDKRRFTIFRAFRDPNDL